MLKTEVGINREEYTKLFRQYYQEMQQKEREYERKHGLGNGPIHSNDHPDYFKIRRDWDERRKILDAPLLKAAKYEVGQKIKFRYEKSNVINDEYKPVMILSTGTITDLHTSDSGSGEIVYCFCEISPAVEIVNPYCLEQDVIEIIHS